MLVQLYIEETYDVEYPTPSCRRLLKEAELNFQKPRRTAAEANENEQQQFCDDLKKSGEKWPPLVCLDQTKKSSEVELRAARHAAFRGLPGQRDWTCLLGAITESGDRFSSRFEEYVTAEHTNISF